MTPERLTPSTIDAPCRAVFPADGSTEVRPRFMPPDRSAGNDGASVRADVTIEESATMDSAWESYIDAHPQGTLFHTQAFRRALASVFNHRVRNLTARRFGRIVGILPLFEVQTGWAGRHLVSVPYGVGGGVLADHPRIAESLAEYAVSVAERSHCRAIDLRGGATPFRAFQPVRGYLGFQRALPLRREDVAGWIPRKARAEYRHAGRRHGLRIIEGDQHLATVWRLYTENMRRLASLNYPFRFFEALMEETPGAHRVSLALKNGRPVAGVVTFTFRQTVMPYFFGAKAVSRGWGAAHLLYGELAEWAVEQGLRTFDFGRSRADNTGSADFKRYFGFEGVALPYQRWTAPGSRPVDMTPANPRVRWARRVWPHLPLCVTRPLGAWLSYRLPG